MVERYMHVLQGIASHAIKRLSNQQSSKLTQQPPHQVIRCLAGASQAQLAVPILLLLLLLGRQLKLLLLPPPVSCQRLLLPPPLLLFSLLLPPLMLLLPPLQQLMLQLLLPQQRFLLHRIRLAGLHAKRQASFRRLLVL